MQTKQVIARNTLSSQVYTWLRQQILSGLLKQGEHLSEQAISETLGVSATPIREALRLLNGDGLVELTGRRGAKVIKPTTDDIQHCFAVRKALECLALREACSQLGPEDLEELKRISGLLDGKHSQNSKVFFEADHAFHEFFVKRARNSWLKQFLVTLTDFLDVVRGPLLKDAKLDITHQEHLAVVQAVLAGQIDKAETLLAKHIDRVCNDVVRQAKSALEESMDRADDSRAELNTRAR